MEYQSDTNQIQQPSPPPQPQRKNSGIFIGILVFILGIIVGMMINKTALLSAIRIPYLSARPISTPIPSPTVVPDETGTQEGTADWKTYTNSKLGFEILHPINIEFLPVDLTGTWVSGKRINPYLELSIRVSEQSPKEMLRHDGVLEWEKQKYLIAGILTDIYSGMSGEGAAYPTRAFALQKEGKTFFFYISTLGNWKEVNQILSTFKFVPSTTSSRQVTVLTQVDKTCTDPNTCEPMKFIMTFPEQFTIVSTFNPIKVALQTSVFTVLASSGGGGGPCPMDDSDPSCTYSDVPLNNNGILRIWRNSGGVFMLNPQSITIQGFFLNNVIIQKTESTVTFTPEEIETWKSVINTMTISTSH